MMATIGLSIVAKTLPQAIDKLVKPQYNTHMMTQNEILTLVWALSPLLVFVGAMLIAMIVKGEF